MSCNTRKYFKNEIDGIELAGMLFIPESGGPFPVAVIIHGSGTSRRDNPWYLSITAFLQKNGVAVLLPDKRGCEKLEGAWVGADFETLATDIESAVNYIRSQNTFNFSGIGIIGMSQGGWIAPIVASRTDGIDFVVNVSGPMVTVGEQLLHEEFYNISPYTYDFIARLVSPLAVKILKRHETVSPFAEYNPIPYWKNVDIPVFVAYGGNDTNNPVDDSVKRMKESGLDHFQTRVYFDGGHAILNNKTSRVSEEFLHDLVSFIQDNYKAEDSLTFGRQAIQ